MAATGKHFPGLGAAKQNTDVAVQKIRLSRSKLRRVDERPYAPSPQQRGDMVMLSTAIYTHFSHQPAAFTRKIATGELRRRLGFKGVSITRRARDAVGRPLRRPGAGGRRRREGGTDLLLYTDDDAAAKAGQALQKRARVREAEARCRSEQSANRVLRSPGRGWASRAAASARQASPPAPLGLSLLGERPDALAEVLGLEARAAQLDQLPLLLLGEARVGVERLDRLLVTARREGGARCDLRGQRERRASRARRRGRCRSPGRSPSLAGR